MASKRRNMFHKNRTQETTENGIFSVSRRLMLSVRWTGPDSANSHLQRCCGKVVVLRTKQFVRANKLGASHDIKTELVNAIKECQKEHDVTNERYRSFFKTDAMPEDEKEKMKNGVYDAVKMKADNRRKYQNEEITHADAVVDACAASLPKDVHNECDYAVEVTKCMKSESKKLIAVTTYATTAVRMQRTQSERRQATTTTPRKRPPETFQQREANKILYVDDSWNYSKTKAVSPDIKTELRNAIVECQKEYDVTNERYRSFFKSDATPENEKEKVTDGVFDTVKLKSDNRRKYNNEEDIKNADAVVDACAASCEYIIV
ncbi:hypothetical protein AAG570_008574 [Ranatra chinensis]|uniref:Uncharacterized protein n=1 Tax=Ranatra chinensis TaxID=642074 RepID=A0ABD0YRC7_9HEMI